VGVAGIGKFWQPSDGSIDRLNPQPEKDIRALTPNRRLADRYRSSLLRPLNDSIRLFRRPVESTARNSHWSMTHKICILRCYSCRHRRRDALRLVPQLASI